MHPILHTLFKSSGQTSAQPKAQGSVNAEQQTSASPAAALQGDIAAFALENVFQLFDFAAMTGKLEIQSTANSGTFFFRKGLLVYGLLRMHQRRIGQILLDSGLISKQQLQECLLHHERSGGHHRFGQILLEKGYVKPESLDKSLLRQVQEAFFEALSWNEGSFRFYPDQSPPPNETQMFGRIDRLLLEGMVRIDQEASDGDEEE